MSFFGNFAIHAAKLSATLEPVLEITLNAATWGGSTELNLSSAAVRARGRAYDPRVTDSGWKSITRQIDIRASGLESLQTSVTVADSDNKLRNALLVSTDQRNSAAAIYRVIPGNDTDYASLFTGLLDSWEFKPGQVILNFRTDDRALKSFQPAWPYLKSEWFWMAADDVGTYTQIVYGKHDSTGLSLDHGLIPTVRAWFDATSAWYATNIGPAELIKDVYVRTGGTTVKQAYTTAGAGGNAYEKIYGSYAGGKIVTMIEFQGGFFPAEDATVTCDLYGYAAVNSGVYDGSAALTNPVAQMRHFLINFAVNRTKGYIPGNWDDSDPIIDAASWTIAEDYATQHGLEGSRYMTDQRTCSDIFREWLESYPMFRAFWNAEGKIELAVLSADWPGYWNGDETSNPLIRRENELSASFAYSMDTSDITGKISAQYLYDSAGRKFLRSLDVQDLSSNILSDTSYQFYWSPSRVV